MIKMCVAVVMAARIEVKDVLVDSRESERQETVVMIAGVHEWPECGGHSWAGVSGSVPFLSCRPSTSSPPLR